METRKLGRTDLYFSRLGLGTWPMGGIFGNMSWGPQDDEQSLGTIITAVDGGINFIDTAPTYGKGHSEEIIGAALKKLAKKPYIVTKCGSTWDPESGKSIFRLDKADVRAQCERSLKRLGIEAIDLYLVHWPMPFEYTLEGWQTCADLVREGKVRYIGVSNFSVEQMESLQPIHRIDCMEPPYSMIERKSEGAVFEYCRKHEMGVITYSPLQQGVLTDVMLKIIAEMAPNDFRRNNPHFKEPEISLNGKANAELSAIASKYGRTLAQLAIAWVLREPAVTAALNGARSPAEIEDSLKALDFKISAADLQAIEAILQERLKLVPKSAEALPPGAGRPPTPPSAAK